VVSRAGGGASKGWGKTPPPPAAPPTVAAFRRRQERLSWSTGFGISLVVVTVTSLTWLRAKVTVLFGCGAGRLGGGGIRILECGRCHMGVVASRTPPFIRSKCVCVCACAVCWERW